MTTAPEFTFTSGTDSVTIGDCPEGLFGLTEFDLGWPSIREVVEDRTGQNGSVDRTTLFGDRAVSISLRASDVTPDDMVLLARLSNPNRRQVMTARNLPNLPDVVADVRPMPVARGINPTDWHASVQRQVLQWRVPSGVFRSITLKSLDLLPVSGLDIGGRRYDRVGDRDYPTTVDVGVDEFINAGSAVAFPRIVIYGPVTDPAVTDVVSGLTYSFVGLTISAGNHLEINTENRTVRFNSLASDSRLKFKSRGPWWGFEPGSTFLAFDGTATGLTTKATVAFSDTFL